MRKRPQHNIDSVGRQILITVLVAAVLTIAKIAFQRSQAGTRLQKMIYVELQSYLMRTFLAQDLPVVVVDISDLTLVGPPDKPHVPRPQLQKIVEALEGLETKPKAIGIDVDFSPENGHWITEDDPGFFAKCESYAQEAPVFLGVSRSIPLGRKGWLGSDRFQDLAAALSIPLDGRTMFASIKAGNEDELQSISAKLASRLPVSKPSLPAWSLERFQERTYKTVDYKSFLIDYSPLETLARERVNVTDPQTIVNENHRFAGKAVLIGRATYGKTTDLFAVPGKSGNLGVPGVLLHAAAVYSLAEPLYEFRPAAEFLLDLGLIAIGLVVVALSSWWYSRQQEEVDEERLEIVCCVLSGLLIVALGIAIRTTRVMWDGFVLSAFVLVVHPYLPRLVESFWKRLGGGWRRVALKHDPNRTKRRAKEA